jgi:hypothetical protein
MTDIDWSRLRSSRSATAPWRRSKTKGILRSDIGAGAPSQVEQPADAVGDPGRGRPR